MTHEHWTDALDRLAESHRPLIALDFDGTLAPFQLDASTARIVPDAGAALARLATAPELTLALVTGRSLTDLVSVAEVPAGTLIVGDHGAQFGTVDDDGPHLGEVALTEDQARRLADLTAAIEGLDQDGAWIEHKRASVALHTRPVASLAKATELLDEARAIGHRLGAIVLEGKRLVELGVVHSTKGQAVATLRESHRCGIVLYAGDDRTDETVFETLTRDDVGIKVGDGPSAATLRVKDPQEMAEFLAALADRLGV
jgi:trehalose 6-phosphate phosphatase